MTCAVDSSETDLSEIAREILGYLQQTHRQPGARLSIEKLIDHVGTDPAVATALSELASLGCVEHPDAHTIELTARGFDAAQRQSDPTLPGGSVEGDGDRHPPDEELGKCDDNEPL